MRFNSPWLLVAPRLLSSSMWGLGRIPYLAPWLAWQLLTWIFCALVAVYVLGKGAWRLGTKLRGALGAGTRGSPPPSGPPPAGTPPTPHPILSHQPFLPRGLDTSRRPGRDPPACRSR